MIFAMEHMQVDYKNGDRWSVQDTDFLKLKDILSKWQYKMEETGGWNSLFWSNHDQPRVVNRFGDNGKYRVESAKMLATVLHMLKGTPYIYQGEEFGMPNPGYETIEEFEDIESLNVYKERKERGIEESTIMQGICRQSRDNGRSGFIFPCYLSPSVNPALWTNSHKAFYLLHYFYFLGFTFDIKTTVSTCVSLSKLISISSSIIGSLNLMDLSH